MRAPRRRRYFFFALFLYLTFCIIGGINLANGVLRPARRPLTEEEITTVRESAHTLHADLNDASITAPDGAILRAWTIRPSSPNGDAVILLHGLGDNRIGMTGYAQLFLADGFTVLLPDARAHGTSGGPLAKIRNDDHIRLSVAERRLDLLVPPDELARRPLAPPPVPERGYALLYRREILQADRGCDFNFLRKRPLAVAD